MRIKHFLPWALAITACLAFSTVQAASCSSPITIYSNAFGGNGDLNNGWTKDNGVRINSVTGGNSSPSVSFDGRSGIHGITSKDGRIDANVTEARLSFWVRRGFGSSSCSTKSNCSEYPDNGVNFTVEYLNNSGSWILLHTYTGGGTAGEIFTYSELLPADALYSNLKLRFRHTGGSGSTRDLWHLDDVLVEECTSSSGPDHYSITIPATAVSCEPITVTIESHDAAHNLTDALGATLSLSTSTGRGSFTPTTATFPSGSSSVTVQLSYPDLAGVTSETINIDVSDGTVSETSGSADATDDPSVTFSNSGFRFILDNGSGITTTLPSQVAGVNSSNIFLEAIQVDTDAANPLTAACVGVYNPGDTVAVEMGGECVNPVSCETSQISINGNNTPVSDDGSSSGPVNLTFLTESRAPITINYSDVGQIRLHAEDASEFLNGSSNPFVVKPYTMVATVIESNDATPVNNPGTTTALPGFLPAATDFRVVVESRNAAGNRTPNYGNETTPETIALNFTNLIFPDGVGESNGILASGTFTNTGTGGEFESTTVNWSEVGTFTFTADIGDGDYLGAGAVASPTESGNIGRFYPADFALSGVALDTWCEASPLTSGLFSYLSQPNLRFDFTVTARNALGATVVNYDDTDLNYSLTTPDTIAAINYHAENADSGVDLATRATVSPSPAVSWDNGIYQITDAPGQLDRAATPDGPFTSVQFSIDVADPDGAVLEASALDQNPTTTGDCTTATNCTSAGLGTTQIFRFGRAIIEDASGPESTPLPVTFGTQYWDGTNFVDATIDSCSTLAFTAISFDTNNPITNPQPVAVGGGTSNGTLNAVGTDATAVSGSFGLSFSAPNTTGQFPVNIDLTNYLWLRHDWNQDGNFDNDTALPTATINFGSYRGHDRVIYWREQF